MKDFPYWLVDNPNNYVESNWYKKLYKHLNANPPGANYDWKNILSIGDLL